MEATVDFGMGVTVKFSCKGTGELMEYLSALHAIAPEPCGLCQSEDVALLSITGKKGPLVWYTCRKCAAQLRIAAPAGRNAWKQRTDDQKRKMPHGGWHHYQPYQSSQPSMPAVPDYPVPDYSVPDYSAPADSAPPPSTGDEIIPF